MDSDQCDAQGHFWSCDIVESVGWTFPQTTSGSLAGYTVQDGKKLNHYHTTSLVVSIPWISFPMPPVRINWEHSHLPWAVGVTPFLYRSPMVSLDIHLNLPGKLVFLPAASFVACTFSSPLPVASKLLNWEMHQFDSGSNGFHWPHTNTCTQFFDTSI